MGAGKYDRLVGAYRPTRTQADNGEQVISFADTPTFSFWANMAPITGHERLTANQPLADLDTRIKARYSPRLALIDATWRFSYRGTFYDLSAPPADIGMKHEEIEFLCNSGKNQG